VKIVEHLQTAELVKNCLELLASGVVTQVGKEIVTTIKDRFVGQPKAEQAIAQLASAPETSPEAARIVEVLLEAEIIKDDIYADRLQQLMVMLKNERSQQIGTDLTATESVEICENEQLIEGSSTGSQVIGAKIEAPSIKISGNTQTQKQTRDL
jgi:hypothetical protein